MYEILCLRFDVRDFRSNVRDLRLVFEVRGSRFEVSCTIEVWYDF